MGLEINVRKMKVMTRNIGNLRTSICKEAYGHRVSGKGISYKEKMESIVECPECHIEFQARHMENHLLMKHNINITSKPEKQKQNLKSYIKTMQQI